MIKELRKRMEEAIEKRIACYGCPSKNDNCKELCVWHSLSMGCAKSGYKEAITQAKKWWKNYYKLPDYYQSETRDVQEKMRDDYEFHMKVVADFEADMNKLWEEKK